jgi:cardiolipin synthase A/B
MPEMSLKKRTKFLLILCAIAFLGVLVFYDFSSDRALTHEIQVDYSVEDPQFFRAMNNLLGPCLVDGNKVDTLINGKEIFPAMLEAIHSAKKSITFETYIYWSGEVGQQFTDALSERARSGVKVRLLLDWVGAKISRKNMEEMKHAGVEIQEYNPLPWYTLSRLNNRTHRKILVVDGKIGFTGGVGVADHWLGDAENKDHWRDTHFRFEGPVVAQMQSAFTDNWLTTAGKLLQGDDYFPPLQKTGDQYAQVFKSSPTDGSETARLMYLFSIACARKSIYMSNAYFVPDDLAIKLFVAAAHRGVHVEIITPGKITDTKFVRAASRDRWGELLKAGVKFYEYQPTMYHCKVMVVDGIWSSVGSTNFDNRSFRLNDEVNLNVYDRNFAQRQIQDFLHDRTKSDQVTLQEWENRSIWEKTKEFLTGLLHHQL